MEDLIKALQIFLKYSQAKWPTACEHDELFVCVDPAIVSEEDKKALEELGFFYKSDEDEDGEIEEYDSFRSFRFGSC